MIVTYILKTVLVALILLISIHKSALKPTHNLESENKDEHSKVVHIPPYRAQYAKTMLSLMNQSVNPCDNFYEFACGNYKNVHEKRQPQQLPPSYLTEIENIFNDIVEELLKTPAENVKMEYETELKLAHQFYNTCLAADLYPMKKSHTYLAVLRSMGGFPAADNTWHATAADNFSWFNMSAHLNNFGASGLIKEYTGESDPYPLFLARPELGFDYKIKRKLVNAINSSANAINEKRIRALLTTYEFEEANSTQIIADIFELWQTILNIEDPDLPSAEGLDDCQKQWNIYYAIAWNGQNMNFTDEDYCLYVKNLNAICEERKEAVANYLSLQFLHHMYARLDDKKFQKEMCLYKLRTGFPYLFDRLYLAKYIGADIHDEVTTIITELRKSLSNLIKSADWIDENTRKVTLLKESAIILHYNYEQDIELKNRLIREVNGITFNDTFDWNNMELMKFKYFMKRYYTLHRDQLANTTQRFDSLSAMVASAEYSQFDNSVTIFPGLLNPPAYHKEWPYALKFSGFGYFMGHELMHAFDASAIKFDHNGQCSSWWSVESYRDFKKRAKCYAEHFSGYVIPEINRTINGAATQNENIADSGGLRIALNAYRNYMQALSAVGKISLPLDEQMPGMSLSPEQLFFLGFAQVWCAAYEEEHYWLWLDNEHTIDKYRVLGALTNFDEFSKVYNCPVGSEMNPKAEKCRIF